MTSIPVAMISLFNPSMLKFNTYEAQTKRVSSGLIDFKNVIFLSS